MGDQAFQAFLSLFAAQLELAISIELRPVAGLNIYGVQAHTEPGIPEETLPGDPSETSLQWPGQRGQDEPLRQVKSSWPSQDSLRVGILARSTMAKLLLATRGLRDTHYAPNPA